MRKILIAVICLVVIAPAVNAGLKDDFTGFLKSPQGVEAINLVSKIDAGSVFDKSNMAFDKNGIKLTPEQTKKVDDAIAECEKTLAEDPKNAAAVSLKTLFLVMEGKTQNAMDFVSRITVYQADADYAWLIKACLLLMQNDMEDSRWAVSNAMKINPENPLAFLLRGCLCYVGKDYDGAIKDFKKMEAIEPDMQPISDMVKAFTYYSMEDYVEVLACLDSLKKEPKAVSNYVYWAVKGECLSKMDYDAEAQAAFDKALKMNKADVSTWKKKAESLRKLEKFGEADKCEMTANILQKAIEEAAEKEKQKAAVNI
jgi:tetratricopeptide (TPR) repeat protein